MMHDFDFSELKLNMEKLPPVGVSEVGVTWLTDERRLLVPFLKDKEVEYPALKAQFQKK